MFLQVSVCPQGGACEVKGACVVKGGMHGERGHAWWRGGHVWQRGVCVAKGWCVVKGHAWRRGCAWWRGGVRGIRRDTINKRAVRILLECILVKFNKFLHINWSWTTSWAPLTCVTQIFVGAGSQRVTVISIGQWFPVIVSRFSSPWERYV